MLRAMRRGRGRFIGFCVRPVWFSHLRGACSCDGEQYIALRGCIACRACPCSWERMIMNQTSTENGVNAAGVIRRLKRLVRANWRVVSCALCLAVFLYLLNEVLEGEIMRLDSLAYSLIVERLRSDALTPVMEGFSALASPVVLVVMTLSIAAFAPGRRPGWCCAVNLVLVAGLNVLIKSLVQRPRPEGFRLAVETGFSFPSGHSMAAMASYCLAYLETRKGSSSAQSVHDRLRHCHPDDRHQPNLSGCALCLRRLGRFLRRFDLARALHASRRPALYG